MANEEITYKIQIDSGDEIDVGSATRYDISALDLGSHTFKVIGTCKHGFTKTAQETANITLKANTLLIEIVDSDEARSWVESKFDTDSYSTRSYVKKSDTQYYVTENNSNWYQLFFNYTYLTKVIDGNTSNVTNMKYMFANCTSLTSVSLPNTSSVTNMNYMFINCTSLTSVSLPNTGRVTTMIYMFSGCTSLTSIPDLDTSKVTTMIYMFYDCTNIQTGMLAFYQEASSKSVAVASYTNCFKNCGTYTTQGMEDRAQIPESWGGDKIELAANSLLIEFSEITDDLKTALGNRFDNVSYISGTNKCIVTKSSTNNWTGLFDNDEVPDIASKLVKVIDGNVSSVTNMTYMFLRCTSLTSVSLPNTGSVTNMNYMFYRCTALTSVSLPNTSSVTNMSNMFFRCTALTSVSLPNTGSVTDMGYMFADCTSLTSVSLPNTGSVTDMGYMFYNCTSLTSVSLSNTGSVTNMKYMFSGCTSLTSIPDLDTSKVTVMAEMFYGCTNIQTGMLAFYQEASSKSVAVASYTNCFTSCGTNGGATAAAERAQIPASWGGDLEKDTIEKYEMTGLTLSDDSSTSSSSTKVSIQWNECTHPAFNENCYYELTIDGTAYFVAADENYYTYTDGEWGATVSVTVKAVDEYGKKSIGQTESVVIAYIDCAECGGTGKIETECETCNGSGEVSETCSDCSGSGYVEGDCDTCGGTGYVSSSGGEEEECPDCGGTGRTEKECETCYGSGEVSVTCSDCSGEGHIETECEACDGTGHYHG